MESFAVMATWRLREAVKRWAKAIMVVNRDSIRESTAGAPQMS